MPREDQLNNGSELSLVNKEQSRVFNTSNNSNSNSRIIRALPYSNKNTELCLSKNASRISNTLDDKSYTASLKPYFDVGFFLWSRLCKCTDIIN